MLNEQTHVKRVVTEVQRRSDIGISMIYSLNFINIRAVILYFTIHLINIT